MILQMMADINSKNRVAECADTLIYTIPDILSANEVRIIKDHVIETGFQQKVFQLPALSQLIWSFIVQKLSLMRFKDASTGKEFFITGISEYLTITNSEKKTSKHKDMVVSNAYKFKMAIYLCDIPAGGTIFYENDIEKVITPCVSGSAILFDLSLYHGSQNFCSGHKKIMVGFRPEIKYVE